MLRENAILQPISISSCLFQLQLLRQTWQPYTKLLYHTESLSQRLLRPRSAPQQLLKTALATCLGSTMFGRFTILQLRRWKTRWVLQELHLQGLSNH